MQAYVVPFEKEDCVNIYLADVTARVQAEERLRASETRLREQQQFTQLVLDTSLNLIYVRDAEAQVTFANRAMRDLQQALGNRAVRAAADPEGLEAREQAHYARADATVRARENFLANMSHEIRIPMNGVLGMTAQLAKTRLDARQQELVRIIRSSGQHLLSVLNDVLEMAKITAGKLELEQLPFNLCHSMETAVQPLALQAQEKGLEVVGVRLRDSCPAPWIVGDAHRLNQILINLVGNAVKLTTQGQITIKGEMLSETEDTLTVRFSVQDTGPGIAPEKQAYIFESFTQAYADTARQHGGTGLGLTISRGLVEQMGGQLTLASEVGKGSTFAFTLTLPKAPAEALPAPIEETVDTGSLAGVRVLLVEDNHINRTVARMMLEPWGVVLKEATSGPEALAMLEQQPYDVVLMDIQMPGMSGVEVTQRLREMPNAERAATPVIAVTANAFRADVERYLAGGFNDYLAKLFDEDELYWKMEALLGKGAGKAYDLTHLQELAQGRTVFVERFIRSFLANIPTNVQQLRTAAAAADWREVARVVHHIKPQPNGLGGG
ncbi:ATP-binding protein [Hymenobacter sp.]|uniref:ATP-binding protein n=1 Tax=Hymenobacter sp. TaxID=1898978 RepID=UPI002ED8E528